MTDDEALSQLYFKDTAFENLMQKRIFNVLLIASAYDAFMMEEDGRVEEQLYFEYTAPQPLLPATSDTRVKFDRGNRNYENKEFRSGHHDAGQ